MPDSSVERKSTWLYKDSVGPGPSLFHLYLSHPVTFYAMPTPELTCLLLLVRGRNLRMVIFEGEDHLGGGGEGMWRSVKFLPAPDSSDAREIHGAWIWVYAIKKKRSHKSYFKFILTSRNYLHKFVLFSFEYLFWSYFALLNKQCLNLEVCTNIE